MNATPASVDGSTTGSVTSGPVVLATDGTSATKGALRYACHEAVLRGVGLHVAHVTPLAMPMTPLQPVVPVDIVPHGRAVLDHAVRDAAAQAPGLEVSCSLVRDTRVHGIVKAARGAGLLVLGRETRRGLERLMTGATTAGAAAHAACPTVAVPDTWEPPTGRPRLVVGIRTAAGAADLLAAARAWARAHDGTVSLVHAWELADPYLDRMESHAHGEEWEAVGRRVLDEALAVWPQDDREWVTDSHVVHGQAAAVLAAAADEADLLMVRRAHEHRPWDHLGSTVRALLLACPAPVEVVPTPGAEAARREAHEQQAGVLAY